MTQPGEQPLARRGVYVSHQVARRRNKRAPDPDVRRAIVAAASNSVREQGVRGLSIAAVLDHAQLSTRAFYRHFESKDELVAAVFLVEAVAAWIDGRLDLAFDESVKSDLRQVSLEAQSKMFSSPEQVSPAYTAILEPLIEQLQRGLENRAFQDIVPATAAKSIHGVVWGATQRQWATGHWERADVRGRTLRFCLRGLGVAPGTIDQIVAHPVTAG
jgi:AcrR family transcriptional regulator